MSRDGNLGKFFLLTFIVTWICFFAAADLGERASSGAGWAALARSALLLVGTIAPSLVAIALTARAGGRAATVALLRPILQWRVDPRWYVFALGYLPAIKLAAALLHRIFTGQWPEFGADAWYVIPAAIFISTWVQAGEEVGWRGYALPRLATRFGLAPASIVLGLIWAVWHLPLFYVPAADTYGQSFPVYVMQVTGVSAAMAWLYWRTDGSLLLVMLMHAAVNNTKGIVPSAVRGATNSFALDSSLVAWLTAALVWVAAIYFLLRMRTARLRRV